LDENFGLGYSEDVDWRIRLEQKGYQTKGDKRVNTLHLGGATRYEMEKGGTNFGELMNKNKDYLKNNYNIEGKLLFNGNVQILKTLLTNGIYLVMENWLRPNEDIGHNMTIRGYDDELGVFIADDPYFGVGVKYKYESFEQGQWKPFNREYMPIYRIEQEPLVKAIIGRDWDEKTMYQGAVKTSKVEIEKNKDDMYAWFNLGTSYYALGDYKAAREAFERSRAIGWPMRMLWYQIQPVQTYNKLGEYQKALEFARDKF